ncbi:hypothetical protein [Vreelandella massiliensis]|uniref:hypothetical protein n=1 Tax=Vreelandella massiliensis TaxID=1816686 RepID=UPI001181883B|nr:hypothetical protein [Halomonas massiliensis]
MLRLRSYTTFLLTLAVTISLPVLAQTHRVSHAEEKWRQGTSFPQQQLPDAFGNTYQLPYPGIRHVLFTADMDANDLIEQSFGELGKGDFTAAGLVYIADISGMPDLVARLFAIPALRDYPFRVLLARDADQVRLLPREEGAVSVISLSPEGKVERLQFIRNESMLKTLMIP